MADKGKLIEELRKRLEDVPPLEGEPDFVRSDETLVRFLKSRDWKLPEAEKLLRATVDWRRESKPLTMDCRWCHEKPGFHTMRQVGFDELGRPVMYASFTQASTRKNSVEDSIAHVTYLIENAKRTMREGIHTWVWVIDCTGISLPVCNPRLGYGVTQVMSNFYPERLGLVICINHSSMFQGVWKAIKVFLHPNTVSKMKLIRSKKKIMETFEKYFSHELTRWIIDEIHINKQRPLSQIQKEFWKGPKDPFAHDPRGCPSYVQNYIDTFPIMCRDNKNVHRPHPNVIDFLSGRDIKASDPSPTLAHEQAAGACSNHDDVDLDLDDSDSAFEIEISDEYQVPKGAAQIQ
ncbi:uncharacterized protein LOC135495857 isoform X2 [Lineus longissimus]